MQASSLLRQHRHTTPGEKVKTHSTVQKEIFLAKSECTDTPYVILVTLKASLLCRLREAWLSYFMINAFNLHRLRGERMEKKSLFDLLTTEPALV